KDIKDNVLRVCGPSSIVDDPIRGLRAVRLATQLDFRIDTQTLALLKEAAPDLTTASPERIRDELFQMLAASRPAKHVRRLIRLRLLQQFCPEVPLLEDIPSHSLQARNELERTLAVMDWLSRLLSVLGSRHDPEAAADMTLAQATVRLGRFRDQMEEHLAHALSADRTARQLLFFAALYHAAESRAQILQADTDKAPSEEVHEARATVAGLRAKALRLSRAEVERVGAVVSNQSLPAQLASQAGITPKSIYRFFRQTGRAGVEVSLLFLAKFLADHIPPPPQELWARQVEMARVVLLAYFEDRGRRVSPPPL
ncbi:MAG: hypothetical protein GTN65_14960, partial [Armatimonadetes bacterium]|nr:hypothetical protein [Armatimonadota bacterium]NIO98362.1 hypothetical protein [Armatimonadota bacterium]